MGLLNQNTYQGGTNAQWADYVDSLKVTPMSFTPMDAAKFVAEATPIIGDAMAAKEIYDELQKPEPDLGYVAVLGGAALIGLIPLIGDAASPAIKKVGKGLLDMADRIEVDPEENRKMKFEFGISHQPGKIILETDKISKAYGDKQVLSDVDIEVVRGEKIAFVGQNGQGKSTLAKIIVDEISFEGSVKLGHNVQLGYFAQNQSTYLDGSKTVLQSAEDSATPENRTKVRDLLGSFLFQGEVVEKKVSVLSGGERNRLALCKLLLQPFNVLIMDEPTNHLDIASKNVLKQALKNFKGTLILVSHDRDFVQGLCEKVISFKEREVKPFLGDINAYLEFQKLSSLKELEKKTPKPQLEKKASDPDKYKKQKETRATQQKLEKTEKKIARLEKEIKEIDFELQINYDQTIAQPNFFDEYQAKKKTLEDLMISWEKIQIELE